MRREMGMFISGMAGESFLPISFPSPGEAEFSRYVVTYPTDGHEFMNMVAVRAKADGK